MAMSISPASPDNESIKKIADYAENQDKSTKTMIRLTKWIIGLTVIMAVLVTIQVVKLFI